MRFMKSAFKKRLALIIAVIVTVQAIFLCCVYTVYAKSSSTATPDDAQTEVVSLFVDSCTEKLSGSIYKASHSRGEWLYELMGSAGVKVASSRSDRVGIMREAANRHLIDSAYQYDPDAPVTRLFAAMTMVKAFNYAQHGIGYIADVSPAEGCMQTAAYYGYFIPDDDNRVYPEAELTEDEWEMLREELLRYSKLKGKRVMSFGDSIMYGTGNNGDGISDMIAEKYGMICSDYAVPGATMGVSEGRDHIPDQIRRAYANKDNADIILINGGTNDMSHTKLGEPRDSRNIEKASEEDFSGGFEKSMWMLEQYWSNIPVVYVRVHDMNHGTQENEVTYGERALLLANKWSAVSVDLFSDTELKTEDAIMCDRYTYRANSINAVHDSIHPTALGYAKYYLPLIGDAVWRQLDTEVKE